MGLLPPSKALVHRPSLTNTVQPSGPHKEEPTQAGVVPLPPTHLPLLHLHQHHTMPQLLNQQPLLTLSLIASEEPQLHQRVTTPQPTGHHKAVPLELLNSNFKN